MAGLIPTRSPKTETQSEIVGAGLVGGGDGGWLFAVALTSASAEAAKADFAGGVDAASVGDYVAAAEAFRAADQSAPDSATVLLWSPQNSSSPAGATDMWGKNSRQFALH